MTEEIESRPTSVRLSKIYYLKENKNKIRTKSQHQIKTYKPSLAHLSSIIQAEKRKSINHEFESNQRLSELSVLPRTHMSERPKRFSFSEFPVKREIQTSYLPSHRKREEEEEDEFFLSDLTEQECGKIDRKQLMDIFEQKTDKKIKRKNYTMRKMEFRNFLINQ